METRYPHPLRAIILCIMVIGLSAGSAAGQDQETPAAVGVTETEVVEELFRSAVEGAYEGEPSRPPLAVIDVSKYLPMPLPESIDELAGLQPAVENRYISFDLEDRTESLGDAPPAFGPSESFTQGTTGDPTLPLITAESHPAGSEEDVPRNFSGLSFVATPEDYPWRVAVKLFMSFRDTGGTLRNYVCSGTLIDPTHVITAGHCVYSHTDTNNGWVFNDWAETITVVPGYENGARPYGDARATQLHSWTGWTSSANFDHDIGIIDLDRPVGALTGWHGYGWYGSCGSFTGGSFRHAGYPAAAPYNGQWMYTDSGSYDSCEAILDIWYGNEVRYNQLSFGGQSGSGSYQPANSCPACWVRAVLSNGSDTYTDDIRITEGKFGNIGTFISNDTPGSVDLVPIDVRSGPTSIYGGNQLSSMDYFVHNYSSVPWSGTAGVDVYLSTNDNISTADTLLQHHTFTWSFSPKSSVRINLSTPPTIPVSMTTGDYYLGVILNISDWSTSNNDTDGQDASPIHINGAPDLVVISPGSSKSVLYLGESTTLSASARNNGVGNSLSTVLRYYRSTNSIISIYDTQIGTDAVSGLAPGSTSAETGVWTPSTTSAYWVGACVDSVTGESNTGNQCSVGVPVTIAPPYDLVLQFVTYGGTGTEEACNSITAGPSVNLPSGSNVTFKAPTLLALGNGFSVQNGATFTADLSKPSLCP
ncbi:MAG: CARDB domain-containing protein [Thermoanaerobaculia bacterium]